MTRALALDTAERAIRTALQASAAAWLIERSFTLDGLKVAGAAAVISVVMALAGSRVADRDSGSVLDTEAGHSEIDTVLLVAAVIGILLLLTGVSLR